MSARGCAGLRALTTAQAHKARVKLLSPSSPYTKLLSQHTLHAGDQHRRQADVWIGAAVK